MTQKELIRQEIERRRQHMVEELMGHEENCEYHRIKGMHDAYVDLLTFLDYSLPGEKPSEDLEEAAEMSARKIYPYEGGTKGLICENAIPIYKAGFIAGAEWQREQDATQRE